MSIIGAHGLLYTSEPEALRSMLRDAFGLPYVDAGGGWLIFRLPPAELGVHPVESRMEKVAGRHQLCFICDDIHATISHLRAKGVTVSGKPVEESYGITVMLDLPGGVEAMLYEPRHALAIELPAPSPANVAVALLSEALHGPAPGAGNFLNPGDAGLLASLDRLSAEEASARPGGRSSVAAHVEHLRYGMSLMNRWAAGENPWGEADWAASWSRQQVTGDEWRRLREALSAEAGDWTAAVKARSDWDEASAANAFGSVVHLAYHLGAIRQVVQAAAGPPAAG
jgi:hypothetical protein